MSPFPTPHAWYSVPTTADAPVIGDAFANNFSSLSGNSLHTNNHPVGDNSILGDYFRPQGPPPPISSPAGTDGSGAAKRPKRSRAPKPPRTPNPPRASKPSRVPKPSRAPKPPRAPTAAKPPAARGNAASLHPDKENIHLATKTPPTPGAGADSTPPARQATDGKSVSPAATAISPTETAVSSPTPRRSIMEPPQGVGRPLHEVFASIIDPTTEMKDAVILPLVEHPFMGQMISGVKDFEFRRYRMSHMVSHVYFYILAPISAIRYVASIKTVHSRRLDGPIPETGVGNKEFNNGTAQWKGYEFAYEITGVWELVKEISLQELKEKYGLRGAPRGLVYAPEQLRMDHSLDKMKKGRNRIRLLEKEGGEYAGFLLGPWDNPACEPPPPARNFKRFNLVVQNESTVMDDPPTAQSIRLASRNGTIASTAYSTNTVQCNLVVLPSRYAHSFISLCQRNSVSCPLIWAGQPGVHSTPLADGADLTTDIPLYNIYANGKLITPSGVPNITNEWSGDHVGFLIGCSYSFEHALTREGYPPKHTLFKPPRSVPMFKTTIPLNPAGEFTEGVVVVSMRPYRIANVPQVRRITQGFPKQHGEPVAIGWGGAARLGIYEKVKNGNVDFGDWVEIDDKNGEIPVFWGCGVTPQVAVMESRVEGTIMSHRPGCMFVSDVPSEDELRLKEFQQELGGIF